MAYAEDCKKKWTRKNKGICTCKKRVDAMFAIGSLENEYGREWCENNADGAFYDPPPRNVIIDKVQQQSITQVVQDVSNVFADNKPAPPQKNSSNTIIIIALAMLVTMAIAFIAYKKLKIKKGKLN
jgi:hypothetical protein